MDQLKYILISLLSLIILLPLTLYSEPVGDPNDTPVVACSGADIGEACVASGVPEGQCLEDGVGIKCVAVDEDDGDDDEDGDDGDDGGEMPDLPDDTILDLETLYDDSGTLDVDKLRDIPRTQLEACVEDGENQSEGTECYYVGGSESSGHTYFEGVCGNRNGTVATGCDPQRDPIPLTAEPNEEDQQECQDASQGSLCKTHEDIFGTCQPYIQEDDEGNEEEVLTCLSGNTATDHTPKESNNLSSNPGPVDYVSFTAFPGIGNIKTMCQLIAALWQLGFIVLFISVFGSFLYGGFLYTSAGVNAAQVNTAKGVFKNAAIALLLGLSVFIILNTINPDLVTGTCGVPSIDQAAVSSGGDNGGSPDLEGACDESYSIIDWKGNPVTELENIYPHWEGTGGYTAYKRDTSFDFDRVSYIGGRPNQLVYDFTVISNGDQRDVPVPSPVSGTVTSAGGSMNAVNIKDSTGHVTRVLHMRGLTVSSGDQVSRCDKIGGQSDKGSPGSVHIHIETTKQILDKFIQDLQ